MKTAIRYYSKFGHSKLMAEAIQQVTGESARTVAEGIDDPVDILFLGAGVFLGKIDKSVAEFIKSLSPDKVGCAVCFGSSAIVESPVPQLRKMLKEQGIKVASESFSCKGAMGPVHRGHPDSKDLAGLQEFVRGLIG